ncbi:MAG: hypothetical protein APF76_15890 [Desulfitibacter sp. BRH_c19]|nr:MAG: hypothetical protein APF76_15890 [Desulfitibacter sp. BRH_c19]
MTLLKRLIRNLSDETAMALYEARQNSLHERANMISTAKAQGRAEGRTESKKELAIAAFKNGLSIEVISNITGLDMKELEKLKAQIE